MDRFPIGQRERERESEKERKGKLDQSAKQTVLAGWLAGNQNKLAGMTERNRERESESKGKETTKKASSEDFSNRALTTEFTCDCAGGSLRATVVSQSVGQCR